MTYNEVIKNLQISLEKHPYIASIVYSQLTIEGGDSVYPAVIILPQTVTSNSMNNSLAITFVGVDMYTDITIPQKQSALMIAIKQSLNRFIDKTDTVISSLTITPVLDNFSDRTVGCTVDCLITYSDDIGECYIPDCL